MCAIFGVIGSYDGQRCQEALALMGHRGPDESHILAQEGLFFSHNRLAIMDPDTSVKQPFHRDGIVLGFNGEIYNFEALKKELKAYPFQSGCDSEVVFAAYLEWGEAFVERLEGMFAIAVYDKGRLLLFRDRMGKKPLYYYKDARQIIFASEIKSIGHIVEDLKINSDAIRSYLSFQTAIAPITFFEGVVSLQPGEKAVIDAGGTKHTFYDDILSASVHINTTEQAHDEIEAQLLRSVQTRMQADVPVGYLLSGGVDSALVCAMAQRFSDQPIRTFTLGYDEFERYDESAYAGEVADHIGAKNEKIIYTYEDFRRDIKRVPYYLDQPLNDPAALPLFHLFERIHKDSDIKVVLSGEGSDELFLGYRPYMELLDIEQLAKLGKKSWLKNYFKAHPSEHREWEWYRRIFSDELLFRGTAESFTDRHQQGLLKDKKIVGQSIDLITPFYDSYRDNGLIEPSVWYRYLDLKVHQGNYFLTKLDRMSMAHAIEARAPYMDQNLVKSSFQIDPALFLHGSQTKHLLKEVARKYLPETIVDRKKRGFSYPFIEWLERMGALDEALRMNKEVKLFYPKALERMVTGAKKGAFKQHMFGIYMLLDFLANRVKR